MILSRPLPRFVRTKILASGVTAFYWDLTGHYRRLGCSIPSEPLGTDYVAACGEDGNGGRAAALNGLFDEWKRARSGEPVRRLGEIRHGRLVVSRVQANKSVSGESLLTLAPRL